MFQGSEGPTSPRQWPGLFGCFQGIFGMVDVSGGRGASATAEQAPPRTSTPRLTPATTSSPAPRRPDSTEARWNHEPHVIVVGPTALTGDRGHLQLPQLLPHERVVTESQEERGPVPIRSRAELDSCVNDSGGVDYSAFSLRGGLPRSVLELRGGADQSLPEPAPGPPSEVALRNGELQIPGAEIIRTVAVNGREGAPTPSTGEVGINRIALSRQWTDLATISSKQVL